MTAPADGLRAAVLGAGSWGTALAAAASAHCPTVLWARSAQAAQDIARRRENARYLPGIALPAGLACTADLDAAFAHLAGARTPLVILGVPVAGLEDACRATLEAARRHGLARTALVWTCKGFHTDDGRLPHEIAAAALAGGEGIATGVLSGPSFASEVARGLPVALTVASREAWVREAATAALHGGAVRVYASGDVVGVETGGAMKNVIAIACGICDGLALGANARAALITRGLAEMTRLGVALGAQAETFAGLTGLGDLVLSATGDLSRNRGVGVALGRGRSLDEILAGGMIAEGVRCAQAVLQRADAAGVDLPISRAVCDVLFKGVAPAVAVAGLLAREARAETPAGEAGH